MGEELLGVRAVDDAVVEAQGEVGHRADGQKIVAVRRGHHFGPLLDDADAEDGDLRLVDDRRPEESTEDAWIGNRKRPARHFVGLELLGAGAVRQVVGRAKQLKPDEVAGGTFTITNPGVFGGLFGTPIINQPQVAILGVGVIEKRPKVMTSPEGDDYLAVRSMAYFALSFDHRIIDGADAERFLSYVKEILEAGQFTV